MRNEGTCKPGWQRSRMRLNVPVHVVPFHGRVPMAFPLPTKCSQFPRPSNFNRSLSKTALSGSGTKAWCGTSLVVRISLISRVCHRAHWRVSFETILDSVVRRSQRSFRSPSTNLGGDCGRSASSSCFGHLTMVSASNAPSCVLKSTAVVSTATDWT